MGSPKPLLNENTALEDEFTSLEVEVSVSNRTTHLDFDPTQGEKCTVREFLVNGVVLDAPRSKCATGHILGIDFSVRNSQTPTKMSALMRVQRIEDLDEARVLITGEFVKVSTKEWEDLTKNYSSRQAEVLDLLEKMRGY